jgi:FtsP/CotA-like multicopper oxidase with cupredoxin domain
MHKRKFLIFVSLVLILVLAALILPSNPLLAEDPNGNGQLKFKDKITPAERKAAAALFQQQYQAALAEGTVTAAQLDPGGVPHYFGPYPNWANSPLPKGVIATIDVTNGGSGYTAPAVEVTDLYYGVVADPATATAVVDPLTGAITGITVTYAGSGYSAPVVTITDAAGTGAAAAATIGPPFTGGIRKFVDSLPGVGTDNGLPNGVPNANNLGQYLPVAFPDPDAYPGLNPGDKSDYYEIAVVEYSEQMHSDLPGPYNPSTPGALGTRHRGYVQLETPANFDVSNHVALTNPDGSPILLPDGVTQATGVDKPHFLGPVIVARRDVPVRIKFYNLLPTDAGGDLFIPVDTTVMGAGMGPNGMEMYTENRATVHLHGNNSVWISDGTPHQWITPAGETTSYPEGVSVVDVPDMDPPGDGAMTFYYTNSHSARLMFYHDHSYGITRLNVYAGEAAAYLVTDLVEKDMIEGTNVTGVNIPDAATPNGFAQVLPDAGIPLVIQDRTFVDAEAIAYQDPTWNWGTGARDLNTGKITEYKTGDLWYPHVYMPAQNPYNPDGANPFGRWHYAAWFWPPATNLANPPVANPYYDCYPGGPCTAPWEPPMMPGFPDNSSPGEAFMDTPIVNGTVYPYLEVEPKAYRFRILNAADDRFFNLQLYEADPTVVTADGRTKTEVKMVPAPDGREGGIPDPATAGPSWIQIGTEGGFLPAPVVVPNQPVTWNQAQTAFNFGNVDQHSLLLGTAERADVIVDFSQYAGKTLIVYNDAPAAFPALDPHYDYYTGDPNQTDIGGAPPTQPGYGPNTRTIMQIRVAGAAGGSEVSSINVTAGGSGYTAPTVDIVGGGGAGATATAVGAVDRISLNSLGNGLYTAPTVTIDPPLVGTQATATATVTSGFITGITLTNGGSGYTSAPLVTIADASGANAAAKATLTITGITLTSPGAGYTSPPVVAITDATGTGAGTIASATLFNAAAPPPYNVAALEAVFAKSATKSGVFEVSQDAIIVPSADYNSAYNASFPADTFVRQDQNSHTFQTVPGDNVTIPIEPKALQDEMGEVFDEYGRMMVMQGLELPFTAAGVQNFIMYGYASPPVEIIKGMYATQIGVNEDGTQIWRITHNGVDSHTIHTHLFNAQLINRVAWDGAILPPDPNELGWKETFRVNPLEHTIIALRAILPDAPFQVPNSFRLLNPTMPEGEMLMGGPGGFFDPNGNPVTIMNHYVNFGWEYVYHCHILAHEEMDMMHAVAIAVPPAAPSNLVVTMRGSKATLTWTDNSINETSFTIQRALDAGFTTKLVTYTVGANTTTFQDPENLKNKTTYYYRVFASNTVGDTMTPGFPTMTVNSAFSNMVTVTR